MHHESSILVSTQIKGNETKKRHLARQLIQHIMALYESIIQKIEHGIGMLWEEYFSQELFNLAKQRVEREIINNSDELNGWFQKISKNIRQKVNNLSDNLISHFDQIIQEEIDILNQPISGEITFTKQEELQDKKADKQQQIFQENKLNRSLYETCTQSSGGNQKNTPNQRLQTVSSQSVCSQDLQDTNIQIYISSKNLNQRPQQHLSSQLLLPDLQKIQQTPKHPTKISEKDSEQHDDYVDGGFYGVLLGLLQAFEI